MKNILLFSSLLIIGCVVAALNMLAGFIPGSGGGSSAPYLTHHRFPLYVGAALRTGMEHHFE